MLPWHWTAIIVLAAITAAAWLYSDRYEWRHFEPGVAHRVHKWTGEPMVCFKPSRSTEFECSEDN